MTASRSTAYSIVTYTRASIETTRSNSLLNCSLSPRLHLQQRGIEPLAKHRATIHTSNRKTQRLGQTQHRRMISSSPPPTMNFGSDNWAGAHPDIMTGLNTHATGFAKPYGESNLDASIEEQLKTAFEHDLSAFFVATGTAANSLALTALSKPGGIVFAHRDAHIVVDECGAPEYLSGGQLRICQVAGEQGKMNPKALRAEVARIASYDVHGGRPVAISVTNPTESGTVYTLNELDAISAIAKEHHLPLHMDGARFANGLVSQSCTPAEMTWKRGVDILSFGATKNGCWCAEAVLFFNKDMAMDFRFLRKRSAQLFSKTRFVSAQLQAYLKDDLWLDIARHSNSMCTEVANVFEKAGTKRPGMRIVRTPQANELFVIMKEADAEMLENAGVVFLRWPEAGMGEIKEGEIVGRFVTSFATTKESVEGLKACLEGKAPKMNGANGVHGVNGAGEVPANKPNGGS